MRAGTINDVMVPMPHSVGSEQTLAVAFELMQKHGIRHLPVRHGGRLVGVLSDRDLYFARAVDQKKFDQMTVESVYTAEPYCVSRETSVAEVTRKMAQDGLGCTLVTDGDKLIGIFTTTDACRLLATILDDKSSS
jgi:acetoin utilization protein AcuB